MRNLLLNFQVFDQANNFFLTVILKKNNKNRKLLKKSLDILKML